MKALLFLSLLSLMACGSDKKGSVKYGETPVAELIAEKGEPVEKTDIPVKDGQIFEYPDNEKFQIENDIVKYGMRDPQGDEKTVLYWKHKFKDCDTITTNIAKAQGHTKAEFQMKCPSEGMSVIFTDGSEFISRVVEHEKK